MASDAELAICQEWCLQLMNIQLERSQANQTGISLSFHQGIWNLNTPARVSSNQSQQKNCPEAPVPWAPSGPGEVGLGVCLAEEVGLV